jgi:hypothetical protein
MAPTPWPLPPAPFHLTFTPSPSQIEMAEFCKINRNSIHQTMLLLHFRSINYYSQLMFFKKIIFIYTQIVFSNIYFTSTLTSKTFFRFTHQRHRTWARIFKYRWNFEIFKKLFSMDYIHTKRIYIIWHPSWNIPQFLLWNIFLFINDITIYLISKNFFNFKELSTIHLLNSLIFNLFLGIRFFFQIFSIF